MGIQLQARDLVVVFFLMIRRPPRSTLDRSSAASDVYKRQQAVGMVDLQNRILLDHSEQDQQSERGEHVE